eukprot:m.494744 g.494744  ORF g.494744 m.494744 type:complete len:502 (+) comp57292_c0_seq5:1312-2817(+)
MATLEQAEAAPRSAGVPTRFHDTAKALLGDPYQPPATPPQIRVARQSTVPGIGERRLSKQGLLPTDKPFGRSTVPSFTAEETLLAAADSSQSVVETVLTRRRTVLAAARTKPFVPTDKLESTFGQPTNITETAQGAMQGAVDLQADEEARKTLYRRSHADFAAGEQAKRGYNWTHINPDDFRFGVHKAHRNDGLEAKRALTTVHPHTTTVIEERQAAFIARTVPVIGASLQPNVRDRAVSPDHAYGWRPAPDELSAADLIHMRPDAKKLRGLDRRRGLIAAARSHLKRANFQFFSSIKDAFAQYDLDGSGFIDKNELQRMCVRFRVPIPDDLLGNLIEDCDANNDGLIDYNEFSNFLNWRLAEGPPTLLHHQIDPAIAQESERKQVIDRVFGVPTIRTDIAAPRFKRVSERRNFGDDSDARGLIRPTLFDSLGVHAKDILMPRTQAEIRTLFENLGVEFTDQTFFAVWTRALSTDPRGDVSVESFRRSLDQFYGQKSDRAP